MPDEIFLTTDEVLEYLQINRRTVYRLIKAGKIPAVRVGRQWRFRKVELDTQLETERYWISRPAKTTVTTSAKTSATAQATRPKVLVVDDESSIRDLFSKTLLLANYDVDVVPNGGAALEQLRKRGYDLLITDLKTSGMDDLLVIREVRQLRPNLPIIIVTGFSTEANAIEAANLGVSGYLTKPVRGFQVLAAVARALEK